MSSAALNIGGIDIVFGSRTVIQSIDLDVAREERFVILGPSGAGKTTLLRAIAGFLAPTRGTIHIDGRDVTALPPERRNAVYMHQSPVLFPHLDVFENVAFSLRLRRLPSREILGRVTDALGVTGLTGYERRMPRTLSGGERHRVALARAVVARPALLLLDEPLSALDPALRSDVRSALLATHRKYQTAYIVVTHDFSDAAVIADRIGVLIDGRFAQISTPSQLFSAPASLAVARFLGIRNEVPGILRNGCFRSPLGEFHAPSGAFSGRAVVMFRPRAARITQTDGVPATVAAIRAMPDKTLAILNTPAGEIEIEVDPLNPPAIGTATNVSVDQRQLLIYPQEAGAT